MLRIAVMQQPLRKLAQQVSLVELGRGQLCCVCVLELLYAPELERNTFIPSLCYFAVAAHAN